MYFCRDSSTDMSQQFDYVVVGAGSAGCALASRLSEDKDSEVLVLEAGGPDEKDEIHSPSAFPELMKSDVDWDYSTVPQPGMNDREEFYPRGKTLGGSSSINAMMYVRGNPEDYELWEALGNAGWGWDDMLEIYKRMESYECAHGDDHLHGTGGPLHVEQEHPYGRATKALIDAAVEVGFERNDNINGETQEGAGFLPLSVKDGKRMSSAVAYLHPALERDNLTAITRAHVTEVLFDGSQATGVAYVQDGTRHEVDADEVILSAGAVDTPKLLMLSGVGPADHLEAHGIDVVVDLPGVGQNLQDHIVGSVSYELTIDPEIKEGEMLCQAVAFERTDPSLRVPDLQYFLARVYFMRHGFDNPDEGNGLTPSCCLMHPKSRGSIELASADPFDDPVIDINFFDEDEDMETMIKGIERAREIGHANALEGIRGEEIWPETEDLEAHIRETAQTNYHPVGTAKMGDDEMAVVDDRLRVHGVEGLRVADASIMPEITTGNTNAPCIAIGERASDFLRGGE